MPYTDDDILAEEYAAQANAAFEGRLTTHITLTFEIQHRSDIEVTQQRLAEWVEESMPEPWFDPEDGDDLWISAIRWSTEEL